MIFDTSFVIDVMRADEAAVLKLRDISIMGEKRIVTSPTIFELFSGLARSQKPSLEKNKIMRILKSQMIIELDNESAEKAGEIHGSLIKSGNGIASLDSMIAGIALVRHEKVLTRNAKDFSKVKGLEIETY